MFDLQEKLCSARRATDDVFAVIREDRLYERPVAERHRLIFYLGHVDAFDFNHIGRWALRADGPDESLDKLFEAGIDPETGQGPTDRPEDWPTLDQVRQYIVRTRARVDALILRAPREIVEMAIEHRLMHAETLAYLVHGLPYEYKVPQVEVSLRSGENSGAAERTQPAAPVHVPGGLATLGRSEEDGFGWDNEFDKHVVRVPAFQIDRFKVTNGDYLEFVHRGAHPPHFWIRRNGEWYLRGMFREVLLPLDWPVYVTQAEATEYAAWRGRMLPTESQYHRAAYGNHRNDETEYPWGDEPPCNVAGNFGFRRWDPVPVDDAPETESGFGAAQMTGNGWEWTSTVFGPFPGFAPAPNYPGYSGNFFDGQHYVMKGGSPRTALPLLRRSFRNWFRPDYPYVYATFRCVAN